MVKGLVIAVVLVGLSGVAEAQFELPAGRFGLATGIRQNTGAVGADYGFGFLLGVEAGYQPSLAGRRYSLGANWGLLWGRFGADNPALVNDLLIVLEMNFGGRLRLAIDENSPRFVFLGVGGTVLRTNFPVDPGNRRSHFGPYVSVGLDQYLSSEFLVALEARYGVIASGPTSLSLVATFNISSL